MAWDLDSLIDLSLRKASEIGALNRADRQAVVADATARWQAELAGRENVARIGEEGATGRATMQYGLGGASDRGLRTHEQIAAGTLGLGRDRLTADVQESGMRDLTTRRGQDIGVTKDAAEQAALAPGRAAQAANWEAETVLRRAQAAPEHLKNQDLVARTAAAKLAIDQGADATETMAQFGLLSPAQMAKREIDRRAMEAKKKSSWW
jgi:hypothetical protein